MKQFVAVDDKFFLYPKYMRSTEHALEYNQRTCIIISTINLKSIGTVYPWSALLFEKKLNFE